MKRLFVIILAIDNIIYRLFGIVTPFRRYYWRNEACKLQKFLDVEHATRDAFNTVKGTNWTTKKVIDYIEG